MKPPVARAAAVSARLITAAIGLSIVALAMIPPFVPTGVREVVMDAFSAVCHQLPHRSPHIDGIQLAACDRCMGIYFGIPLAALLFSSLSWFLRRARDRAPLVLVASLIPMGLDWGLDALGFAANTVSSRWLTGLVFGLAAGYYLTLAISDIVRPKITPN